MNINAIKKVAKVEYSADDEGYVVSSALCTDVIGVGDTELEAWKTFDELLQDHFDDMKAGRLAKQEGPGRPKKNKKRFHAEIDEDVKEAIAKYAKELKCSQGEVVEYLYRCHEASPLP